MRIALLLFPPDWRRRYGEEFRELFAGDPRHLAKWLDLLLAAGNIRLLRLRSSPPIEGMIALALVVVTTVHAAVGVGMDERLETLGPAELSGHWWAVPVTLLLLGAAALVVLGAVTFIHRARDARRAVASIVVCGAGAFGASALTAAIQPGSASPGAAAGLLLAVVLVRLLGGRSPSRADLNLVIGMLLVVFLGWRAAANPLWPALLLVTAGLLLASASFPPGRRPSRIGPAPD
jgi:hypothetical protein